MSGLDTAPKTTPEQPSNSITTGELEAMVAQPDTQGAAAEALDNAPAETVEATVQRTPSIKDDLLADKGAQLDGLRAGVARAAETTNSLVTEADAREAADFTPEAQIDRKDIVEQQRATNRIHEAAYQQERVASLQDAADKQMAQYAAKESLWSKGKRLLGIGKKPTDANTGGGEA